MLMTLLILYCRMGEVNILDELMKDMAEINWEDELEEGEVIDKENVGTFKCPVDKCQGKSFVKRFTLERHWHEVHAKTIKLFECRDCKRMFKRPSDVKRHSLKFHGREAGISSVVRDNKFYIDPEGKTLSLGKKNTLSLKRPLTASQGQQETVPTSTAKRVAFTQVTGVSEDRTSPLPKVAKAPGGRVALTQMTPVPEKAPSTATSQIAQVPGARKVGEKATAPLPTSRDMLLKHLLHAREQAQHWQKVEREAKEALNSFDKQKEKARLKDLERMVAEERQKRREAESKVRQLEQRSALKEKMDFVDFLQSNEHFSKF